MIRAKARNLLELLRTGKGISGKFSNYYDKETGKIIDVIVNECKSLVKNSEGELRQYESTTSIGHIREIVNQLLSDRNTIGPVQAGVIMRDNGILGLSKELKVIKIVDKYGKLKLDIEKPFPDNFRDIIMGIYNERELTEKIIKPYVAGLCEESEELSKRHIWSKRLNPFRPRKLSTDELQKRYSKYLEKNTDLDEEKRENMSRYFVVNILGSDKIKSEIITDEINGTGLTVKGEKKRNSYTSMLQNMAANVLDIMGAIENPNDRLAEIENIYDNIEEQLEALSTELVPDSNQIEETIINFNRAVNNKDKEYTGEDGYRSANVTFGRNNTKSVGLLEHEFVPQAMKLYSKDMADFLEHSSKMSDEEYIKQVAKFHFRFVRIHPFIDGNGRTARAITNSLLSNRDLCATFEKYTKSEYIKDMNSIITDYDTYNKGLYTDQSICSKMEDENIQKLADYITKKCQIDKNEIEKEGSAVTTDLSKKQSTEEYR